MIRHELKALTFSIGCQTCFPNADYTLLPNPGQCLTLIHPNECNLTVRPRGSSNHHFFVMLRETPTRTLTTHPLISLSKSSHRNVLRRGPWDMSCTDIMCVANYKASKLFNYISSYQPKGSCVNVLRRRNSSLHLHKLSPP